MERVQAWSFIGELRSYMPQDVARKKNKSQLIKKDYTPLKNSSFNFFCYKFSKFKTQTKGEMK